MATRELKWMKSKSTSLSLFLSVGALVVKYSSLSCVSDLLLCVKEQMIHISFSRQTLHTSDTPWTHQVRGRGRERLTRIPCQRVVNLLVKTLFLIGLGNWVNLLSAQAQPISSPQL